MPPLKHDGGAYTTDSIEMPSDLTGWIFPPGTIFQPVNRKWIDYAGDISGADVRMVRTLETMVVNGDARKCVVMRSDGLVLHLEYRLTNAICPSDLHKGVSPQVKLRAGLSARSGMRKTMPSQLPHTLPPGTIFTIKTVFGKILVGSNAVLKLKIKSDGTVEEVPPETSLVLASDKIEERFESVVCELCGGGDSQHDPLIGRGPRHESCYAQLSRRILARQAESEAERKVQNDREIARVMRGREKHRPLLFVRATKKPDARVETPSWPEHVSTPSWED